MSALSTLRRLERRATTLHRASEEMMSIAMKEFGPHWTTSGLTDGDNLTDAIDNVMHQAELLGSILDRAITLAKRAPTQHKESPDV